MSDQTPQPIPIQLNGGVFPDEHGNWRVVVWLHGIRTETEASRVSGWLNGLLQAHMSAQPPQNPEPPRHDSNGAAPPRPDPSVPFAKP